ncbi:uncharacterized protein LOC143352263 isoform X2 [Halictus rubicundus]|uniref:uncharacterized protein LOC143352263 isoform X2 n=1 Tax=Halictus rubicundus TaxID=77578 RepID=UPI00403666D3
MYQLALADSKLRHALNLGSHCGIVMFLTWLMTIIVLVCSLMKFPRKKSVTDIGPAYNCIRKHLQQTDVFQEKTKKMLRKELLELEILNSRINCINKLLKSETQSKWQRSRLPKVYYRPIDSSASK